MLSREFVGFAVLLVISPALITLSSASLRPLKDNITLIEIPDEPQSYCGLQLKRAIRIYCREKVIEAFKAETSKVRSFHKPSRCGLNLLEQCCFHSKKCSIETFVQFCPYKYYSSPSKVTTWSTKWKRRPWKQNLASSNNIRTPWKWPLMRRHCDLSIKRQILSVAIKWDYKIHWNCLSDFSSIEIIAKTILGWTHQSYVLNHSDRKGSGFSGLKNVFEKSFFHFDGCCFNFCGSIAGYGQCHGRSN